MTRAGLAGVVMLGIVWLCGLASLPHALEPGRADEAGVRLNLLVDVGDGRSTNDWFTASTDARIVSAGMLNVEAQRVGLQLLSRPLPVYPAECYALDLSGAVVKGDALVLVQDEDIRQTLATRSLPITGTTVQLVFSSNSFRRVTIAFWTTASAVFTVGSVEIKRLRKGQPCT